MSYEDDSIADARLRILQMLAREGDYTAHEHAIRKAIANEWGHGLSTDTVRAQLAWLDEQGLITMAGERVLVARLTLRGEDVATGVARVPGVARPRPGE